MIPTLFSVGYAGLWGQHRLDLEAFLKKAGALGYRAVELMGKAPHLSILENDQPSLESIRETAEEAGVEVATIAGYTDFTLGYGTEIPAAEIQVAYVRALAQAGQKLGARILRVFTGYCTQPECVNPDWRECVEAIRQCARVAGDHGLILGVQNHHDVGGAADAFLEFLHDVDHPNCRAMFDPWAPALHGDDLRESARRIAPYMVQTTLADYVRLSRFKYLPGLVHFERLHDMVRAVPLGDGVVDLNEFFAGLKEGGFHGHVAYEMCSPLRGGGSEENLDRAAAKSLAVIEQLSNA